MTRSGRDWNRMETYGSTEKLTEHIVQNAMEADGNVWNTLEATVSYRAWARLTPTLTHIVAYELATSGAEDRAMSTVASPACASLWPVSMVPRPWHPPFLLQMQTQDLQNP